MPCPHFDVRIIQRSSRQSAVASAAYQSGDRLFSEYDQKQKYYSHKSEIVHKEILLPPHAHILLSMRATDETGKWLPKCRKVYDLDEAGERIRLPSGRWKSHKEDTVDWNDQSKAELWRQGWSDTANRYLEAAGRPERLDLRFTTIEGMKAE